jgi:hypothetical protein
MEPGVLPPRLLASESGRTFASVGVVVLRESYDYMQRLIRSKGAVTERDYVLLNTLHHEYIHFLHTITTAYVYQHSLLQC